MFSFLLLSGCATGPYGADFNEFVDGPFVGNEIRGIITVEDKTNYSIGSVNYRKNPKEEIIRDIKNLQQDFVETPANGFEYHFIYYQCENVRLFPTKYEPLNFLIHIATIGIYPVGSKKDCRTELQVKEIASRAVINTSSLVSEEVTGGSYVHYTFFSHEIVTGSWRLPARRLLQRYQFGVRPEQSTSR